MNKIIVQVQLFCRYSSSAELPRVSRSATLKIGIQTETMLALSELFVDYTINKFKPPKDYKLEAVYTGKNWVVERKQLQDCGYLLDLVASFEEEYIWLEVKSVWRKPPRKVSYRRTFGTPDQGQTLDV